MKNPRLEQSQRCFYLESGRMFTPEGEVRPCCRFDTSLYDKSFVWNTSETYYSSLHSNPILQIIDQEPSQIKGCHKCLRDESSGIKSMRQKGMAHLENDPGKIRNLEIAVGRICNLKCRSCGPKYSTKWDADAKLLGLPAINTASQFPLEAIPDELLADLYFLKISGGEPLLHKDLVGFLNRVKQVNKEPQLKLELYTNGTMAPHGALVEALKKFEKVNLLISVDSIGLRNTYLRPPLRWDQFEFVANNWFRIKKDFHFQITFATTVSSLSIPTVRDLILWAQKLEASESLDFVFQILQDPRSMSLFFLPNLAKKSLSEAFEIQMDEIDSILTKNPGLKKRIQVLRDLLKQPNSQPCSLDEIYNGLSVLDQLRGENFSSTFPEVDRALRTARQDSNGSNEINEILVT